MTILFKDLVKIYNGKTIFENINGKINDGDKIGIVGINGVGKTTLIKILVGEEQYDSGKLEFMPSSMRIGYLKQNQALNENITISQEIKQCVNENISYNTNTYEKNLKKLFSNVGFNERDLNKKISKLSGGEKTKLSLSITLANNPDLLILDEPTNHLDVDTIKWLESFLNKLNKTIIIISHDRLFLDNTVNKIFEMQYDKIQEYSGNYSDFKYQQDIEIKNNNKEFSKQQREIKHLEHNIEQKRQWFEKAHRAAGTNDHLRQLASKHMSCVWSKEKKLEKVLENKIDKYKSDVPAAFYLINKNNKDISKLPNYLIKINRLKKSFGNKTIFDNASMNLKKGDKAALIGENGCGKTTLLKMLLANEKPNSGTVSVNPSLKIGYFSQELETLNYNNTILDEITSQGICKNDARLMLACLLFKKEDVFKLINNLSMGEKCRVAFAKLLLSGNDILILDEPTNYMDIVSKENIEEVLSQYEGTILFVSHDRYFIKSFATKIFEIENHTINTYDGDYEYYLNKKNEEKTKESSKIDYDKVKTEIIKLECEIAFLSGKLDDIHLTADSKIQLNNEFLSIAHKLNEYKKTLSLS